MPTSFQLCPECLAQFQGLQFNANAAIHFNLIPFSSVLWDDELPSDDTRQFPYHKECNFSVIRLMSARKQLWKSGSNSEAQQQLLSDARNLVPNWPGFLRLSLTPEQQVSLQLCEEETADMMESLRQDAPIFTETDEGGGVSSFTRFPRPPQPE
jgi:hypothetical protein